MEATVRWIEGLQFVGVSGSSHSVVLDTDTEHGGRDTAATPMELVLIALGGCTGMDVVSLLRKMRVNFHNLEIRVKGDRREEHPRIFTSIELEYVVYGTGIDRDAVKRAIELSQQKYCSVSALIQPACPVQWSFQIVEPEPKANA